MADFDSLMAAVDATVANTFQRLDSTTGSPLPLIVHYNDGTPDATVQAVVCNPAFEDDYVPGSTKGVASLILFIPSTLIATPIPHGCTATYNGVDYDISEDPVDRVGGRKLKMRQRALRFDR